MITQASQLIATITEPAILLALTILISIFLYTKNKKSQAILLAATSIFTALAIKIIKAIVQAPRPLTSLIQETGYSFPSGHTTFSIVFFGLMTYIFTKPKHRTPAIITSALLITIIIFSRLQLQVHHPIDIIGGTIIGTIILISSILIHKKFTSSNF